MFTPSGTFEPGDLLLRDGRIVVAGQTAGVSAEAVDVTGHFVVPGFIDLQVNGGGGRAVLEGTREALRAVAESLAPLGTTSFLPTIITAPESDLLDAIEAVRAASHETGTDGPPAAGIAGIHVEGPFLHPEMAGAHPREHIRPPDVKLFERLAAAWEDGAGPTARPALITLAPELSGADLLLAAVRDRGWLAAFGHTQATFREAERAVEAGVRLATHAFNRMGRFHHREPGVLGLVLSDPRVTAGFIADGIHVHPGALRAALRLKGATGAFLVSDATPIGDRLPESGEPAEYRMGQTAVFAKEDRLVTSDGTLAGALLSPRRALANAVRLCGFTLEEALPWVTSTPARVLGLEGRKGVLAPGADADVAVLDADLELRWTCVSGRVALDAR